MRGGDGYKRDRLLLGIERPRAARGRDNLTETGADPRGSVARTPPSLAPGLGRSQRYAAAWMRYSSA